MPFWSRCQRFFYHTVDLAADTLNAVGSLACSAGGATMIASYAVGESVNVSYYGSVTGNGTVGIQVEAEKLFLSASDIIPANYSRDDSGSFIYPINDFLNPEFLKIASICSICVGTLMKITGNQLKTRNKSDHEEILLEGNFQVDVAKPSWSEYRNHLFSTFFSSASYTLFSSGITILLLDNLLKETFKNSLTHPSSRKYTIYTENYEGPIAREDFFVNESFAHNGTFNVANYPTPIPYQAMVDIVGLVNVSYGIKLSLSKSHQAAPIASMLVVAGFGTHLVERFFSQKAAQQRNERLGIELHPLAENEQLLLNP